MRFLPILSLVAAALVSCDRTTDPPDSGAGAGANGGTWPATLVTKDGGFAVTLSPTKGAIVRNEHFSLDLFVEPSKAGGGPLKVAVDADMPAHRHGMHTQPVITDQGDNTYQIDGMLFHMSGEWVITVEVTGDGEPEQAAFPVLIE
jgi:hypothetical protein